MSLIFPRSAFDLRNRAKKSQNEKKINENDKKKRRREWAKPEPSLGNKFHNR